MPYKTSEIELSKLLALTLERNASDLHLLVGEPPILRVDSQLLRLEDYQVLSSDAMNDLVELLLHDEQKIWI
jgi:twitching motility protein PilT